jgi:Ca2+-binding EF-hand superfamily protein
MMGQGMMGQGMMGGMMGPGMMGQGMMGPGAMGSGMGQMRMMGHGHAMKIMFAIADGDANGALSFEEVSALHKRIFDAVDADNSGDVTREEIQSFMRE